MLPTHTEARTTPGAPSRTIQEVHRAVTHVVHQVTAVLSEVLQADFQPGVATQVAVPAGAAVIPAAAQAEAAAHQEGNYPLMKTK